MCWVIRSRWHALQDPAQALPEREPAGRVQCIDNVDEFGVSEPQVHVLAHHARLRLARSAKGCDVPHRNMC